MTFNIKEGLQSSCLSIVLVVRQFNSIFKVSTRFIFIVLFMGINFNVYAEQGVDAELGYPRAVSGNTLYVYADSGMPENCAHPKIEEVIRAFESGETHYLDFQPDETVTKGWETFHPESGLMECPVPEPEKTGDYCWRWLSDPVQITDNQLPYGVSVRMAPTDNRPHYHFQRECFYIFEGETLLNVDGEYKTVKAGTIIDSGPNAIHDFVAVKPGIYAQMYWYPDDGNYKSFLYGRRNNTTDPVTHAIWDKLDAMRTAKGLAPHGATPAIKWWVKNNES